jgi:hypothetical protein
VALGNITFVDAGSRYCYTGVTVKKAKPDHIKEVTLNSAMEALLHSNASCFWAAGLAAPKALLDELSEGFEWDHGRLIYKGSRQVLPGETKSDYEFSGSKRYLGDYVGLQDLETLIRMGIGFALDLANELTRYGNSFTIYIFGHGKDEYNEHDDCCVQFHLDRSDEPPALSLDNIHHPKWENATLILKFSCEDP